MPTVACVDWVAAHVAGWIGPPTRCPLVAFARVAARCRHGYLLLAHARVAPFGLHRLRLIAVARICLLRLPCRLPTDTFYVGLPVYGCCLPYGLLRCRLPLPLPPRPLPFCLALPGCPVAALLLPRVTFTLRIACPHRVCPFTFDLRCSGYVGCHVGVDLVDCRTLPLHFYTFTLRLQLRCDLRWVHTATLPLLLPRLCADLIGLARCVTLLPDC